MFIQTEQTPNPNAIKFIPGMKVASSPQHFTETADAKKSFLVQTLLNTKYIKEVFLGAEFITVTKENESDWEILKPEVIMIIMNHITSGLPIIEESDEQKDDLTEDNATNKATGYSKIEQEIIEIIETRVRPAVSMDGGDIIYQSFEDGVVKLQLHGACSGCPSSTITLKNGIESMLKHYIPEVKEVQAVDN